MQKLEKLRELVSDAKNVIEKGCSQWEFRLDSANFQTKSKDDFEKYRKVFEGDGLTLLMELSHASRKIRVYQIPENLKTEYAGLTYIELTGPKPGKKLERTEWEYVSFVIDDYDKFIQHGCKSPDEFNKVRKVGSSKFCYYADLNNRLQFRNKSISEAEEVELGQGEQAEEKFTSGVGEIQKEREMRLKLMADFDNYRKSTEARIEKIQAQANRNAVVKLFEVIDDIERAQNKSNEVDGIKHIYDKLLRILNEEGYEKLEIKGGDSFDPHSMEALSTINSQDKEMDNKVQKILQNGYVHKQTGEIVRLAKVVVAKFNA